MEDLQALVDSADVAALLRAVDALCTSREWDGLADLSRRCLDAVELGKQLWPVAMHIDYRLAWEGPAHHAAAVLRPGAGRFALGPLTEVAASTHTWEALSPHIDHPAAAAAVAQERVLRGEDLRGRADEDLAELPLRLFAWEPAYALPTYRDREAAFPEPDVARRQMPPVRRTAAGTALPPDHATRALRDVVEVWAAQSNGRVATAAVDGPATAAVACLDDRPAVLEIAASEAVALLQWAGASGGAYGRRPGGAAGRFSAWWSVAALAGLPWPESHDEAGFGEDLGVAARQLRWYRWEPAAPAGGWALRLAVSDPVDGLSWAVDAVDRRVEDSATVPSPAGR